MKIGQKFGEWEVIDSKSIKHNHMNYILCYDEKNNNLRYVKLYNLVNGFTKSSLGGSRGHSTRYKHKHLPKYVYKFELGNIKYRVIYKTPGTNKTNTIFYFHKLKDAKDFAKVLN